ncbi:MAG: SDR family oxidoreductase [Candidatus Promineofilum sp.]|nr:SDR family oxidoreductase [Promineifilum sp.]
MESTPKTLALFGATGRTGRHLLQQALERGYNVRVLARDPGKLAVQSERLVVVRGNLKDAACVEEVITGADAVLSVLGPTSNEPTFEISRGTADIMSTMKRQGVKRLIISAGAGVGDPGDTPKLFNKLINVALKATARNVYEDMLKTVDQVRGSGLEWTVVRVPRLTDGPKSGQVRVGMVGKGTGANLSRADMAEFMLKQVNDSRHLRQAPVISN